VKLFPSDKSAARHLPEQASRLLHSGFSLLEILVAISLLTLIVLGLMTTFNQVQRSFKTAMMQKDVLETGRVIMEMVGRDADQIAPLRQLGVNFSSERSTVSTPLTMDLTGSTDKRTNTIQDVFFTTRFDQDWSGIGYAVVTSASSPGVGTLYRYNSQISKLRQMTSSAPSNNPVYLFPSFHTAVSTLSGGGSAPGMSRIADGVVHFQARPFDPAGQPIPSSISSNIVVYPSGLAAPNSYFISNAVPAFIEIELGIVEPQVLQRARATGDPAAYIARNTAHVHLFRQRFTIRNSDPAAFLP
jgi:prepilin-type N-terminal cleavage/methylation domain-containing protein